MEAEAVNVVEYVLWWVVAALAVAALVATLAVLLTRPVIVDLAELAVAPDDDDQLDACRCCIGGVHDHSICSHPGCQGWRLV